MDIRKSIEIIDENIGGVMAIGQTIGVINDMVLDGVITGYAISGAIAFSYYVEVSYTEDLDILVNFDTNGPLITLGPIIAWLSRRGYSEWHKEGIRIGRWPVQFLPVTDQLDQDALAGRVKIGDDLGDGVNVSYVLAPEYLCAIGLRTGRLKDFTRIDTMLKQDACDQGTLKAMATKYGLVASYERFCVASERTP